MCFRVVSRRKRLLRLQPGRVYRFDLIVVLLTRVGSFVHEFKLLQWQHGGIAVAHVLEQGTAETVGRFFGELTDLFAVALDQKGLDAAFKVGSCFPGNRFPVLFESL